MSESAIVFFLVVVQVCLFCCCFFWLKSHCGMAGIALRGLYRVVTRSNAADTDLAESGYAKAASPKPPPRPPQVSAEQQQPLMVVPQMPHHFQPYQVYQPQMAPSLPISDLPYPPAAYPHQMGFIACDPRPYVRKSPSKVAAPAAETEKNHSEASQPHKSTPSVKHA